MVHLPRSAEDRPQRIFTLPTLLALLFILLPAGLPLTAASQWENVSNEKGITVQRVYEEGSPIMKFRAFGVISASAVEILALLQDTSRTKKWNSNSYNNRIVARPAEGQVIYYSVNRVPWPFEDRDYVVHITFTADQKNRQLIINGRETVHRDAPPVKGLHRMKLMRTRWVLKPLAKYRGKKTWVEFYVHADPGGNIPNWLINMISKLIPRKTIENIRAELKRGNLDPAFLEKYSRYREWY